MTTLALPRRYRVPAWGACRVLAIIGELIYFTLTTRQFAGHGTGILNLTEQFAPTGVLALGLAMVILTGNIDLSCGASASLAAVIAGTVLSKGGSPALAIVAAIAVSTLFGLFNGLIVAFVGIDSLLVTLATQFIVTSIATSVAGAWPPFGFSSAFTLIGQGSVNDVPAMAQGLIDAVVAKFGSKGIIGILSSTPDATIQNAWIGAMRTYIAQKYPNLKIGPIGYGQSNQATSQTQATNLINSNPDLLALIPIDGAAVPGALAAVQAVGKVGKVGVFGIGDPNPNQKYFANSSLTGLFLWDEVKEGELIANVARLVADGKMPAAGGTFTAGSLGTFTVSDSPAPGTIIFSKPLEFTKANYLQYNF